MDFTNGTVADFDQLQMDAIRCVRQAKTFFVATLNKNGDFGVVYCSDGALVERFVGELGTQVAELLEERNG